MHDAAVYPHAPVVEAVIDLRVEPDDRSGEAVDRLAEELSGQFPQKNQLHVVAMEMNPEGTSMKRNAIGWRLTTSSGDRVLQVRQEGLTYSHMSPYTRWSVFRQEAKTLWDAYLRECAPKEVSRVALRYINRLNFPAGEIRLEDYLAVIPAVPPEYLPIQGLLMQLQGRHEAIDPQCGSMVTLASEPSNDPTKQSILLDIDVFVERRIPIATGEYWEVLDKLRLKKNQLFETAITDKLRETFK